MAYFLENGQVSQGDGFDSQNEPGGALDNRGTMEVKYEPALGGRPVYASLSLQKRESITIDNEDSFLPCTVWNYHTQDALREYISITLLP